MHLNKLFYDTLPWHISIIIINHLPPASVFIEHEGNKQYNNDGLIYFVHYMDCIITMAIIIIEMYIAT